MHEALDSSHDKAASILHLFRNARRHSDAAQLFGANGGAGRLGANDRYDYCKRLAAGPLVHRCPGADAQAPAAVAGLLTTLGIWLLGLQQSGPCWPGVERSKRYDAGQWDDANAV